MSFSAYLRQSLWDYILCICAASSLCSSCLIAFQATSPLQGNVPLVIAVNAAILALLFIIAYRPLSAGIGAAALVVVFCVAIVAAWRISGVEILFGDGQGNGVFAVIIFTLSSVLTFVLSRKKTLTIVLLVGGAILSAAMEYLYWQGHVLSIAIFIISAGALIAYRNYQDGLRGSQTEAVSFSTTAIATVLVTALGTGLSFGLFAVVISPLSPPNVVVKLITEHKRVQEEHLRGVGDTLNVENKNLFSLNTSTEQQDATGNEGQLQQKNNMDDVKQANSDQTSANAGSAFALDKPSDENATAVSMHVPEWAPFAIGALIIALIAAAILIRKALRHRWLASLKTKRPSEQAEEYFLYFLRSLGRMDVPMPHHQTIREYAKSIEPQAQDFEQTDGSPAFTALATTYGEVVYGAKEPEESELRAFDDYYAAFHKRSVRFVGRAKYLIVFFRI